MPMKTGRQWLFHRGAIVLLFVFGVMFTGACAGAARAGVDEMPAPDLEEKEVAPEDADEAVLNWREPHLIVRAPDRPRIGALLLFLPGTGARPTEYRDLLGEAAARGYETIALRYANDLRLSQTCTPGADRDCHGAVREEVVFGVDASPLLEVAPPDSIVGRTSALLRYLAEEYPDEHWDDYLLPDGQPNWSRIAVSGYSQGAGHAAFLAKRVRLLRVGMYSGPADICLGAGGKMANWLTLPSATPVDAYVGFTHKQDEALHFSYVLKSWKALGLSDFGPAINVDRSRFPFRQSRQLYSELAPAEERDYAFHGATVRDRDTPRDARGAPMYRAIWRYVSFPY